MRTIVQTFLFLVFTFLLFNTQAVGAFVVSPLRHNITVSPGNSGQFVYIEVKNDSKIDQQFQLEVLSAQQKNDGQLVFDKYNNESEKWIKSEYEIIEIKSGEKEKIEFLIKVPKDAKSGDYYFGLAAKAIGKNAEGVVGVIGQLVTILELQVAGVVNESLSIDNVKLPPATFSKKWSAIFSLNNTSPVDLPISGAIFVKDATGKGIYKKDINFGKNLLPKSSRSYTVDIILPDGEFYIPGLYTTELTVNYGLTNQSTVSAYSIWFLPVYALVAGIILILVVVYSIFHRKRLNL